MIIGILGGNPVFLRNLPPYLPSQAPPSEADLKAGSVHEQGALPGGGRGGLLDWCEGAVLLSVAACMIVQRGA